MSVYKNLLSNNGGFSLPFLIHIYNEAKTTNLYFCNANENINYNGVVYAAAGFSYSSEIAKYGFDGGGTLEISANETDIKNIVELNKYVFMDVTGVMNEAGEITPVKGFSHKYGKISGTREKITFNYDADDRPAMTFPSLIWSTQNNRGNA